MDIHGKKILLIASKFFGYENDIKKELEAQGASVDMVLDRPFNSALMKVVTKTSPLVMQKIVEGYYKLKHAYIFVNNYDILFVIEGITVSKNLLRELKKKNREAKFILYVWDSVSNRAHIYDNKDSYDRVLSFDPIDAKKYGVVFRPLFYTDDFKKDFTSSFEYDLSFIGTIHSDRYEIVQKVASQLCVKKRIFLFLYFHAYWFYILNKIMKKTYRFSRAKEFNFLPIPKKEVAEIIKCSSVVLDIEHPLQVGLTMRTFEALGAKRKLITTNSSIANYDFYSKRNVCLIDRGSCYLEPSFFETPFEEIEKSVYEKYSLSSWVKDCFNFEG